LAAYSRLGVPVIADPPEVRRAAKREGRRLGPLAGILAGMEWSLANHPHAGWILSVPADVPFLPLDLTVRLCGLMHVPEPDVLMVREGRRRQPALAVWSVKLAPALRRAVLEEGVRKVEEFAERHRVADIAWPARSGAFFNINTPQDLAIASSLRDGRPSKR
jgi:molybdopterin-guanine dinucleotide biosynthesis protein A